MIFWIIICHALLSVNSSPFFNWGLTSTTKVYRTKHCKPVASAEHITVNELLSSKDEAIDATTSSSCTELCGGIADKDVIKIDKQSVTQTNDSSDVFPTNCEDEDETTHRTTESTTSFSYFKKWFPEPPVESLKPCNDKNSQNSYDYCSTGSPKPMGCDTKNQETFPMVSCDKRVDDRTLKIGVYNCSKSNDPFSKINNGPEIKYIGLNETFNCKTPCNKLIFMKEGVSSTMSVEINTIKSKESVVSIFPYLSYSLIRNRENESIDTSPNSYFTSASSPRSYMLSNFAITKTLDNNSMIRGTTHKNKTVDKQLPIVGAIPFSCTTSISKTQPIISSIPLVNTESYLNSLVEMCGETTSTTMTCHNISETTCQTTQEETCEEETCEEETCEEETCEEETCEEETTRTCETTTHEEMTTCTDECKTTTIQMTTANHENRQKLLKVTLPTKRVYGGELNVKFKHP